MTSIHWDADVIPKKRRTLVNMPEAPKAKFEELMHTCCQRKHLQRPIAKDVKQPMESILSAFA